MNTMTTATAYKTSEITVMLLAAGEGRRMRPLTNTKPKPLLEVQGLSLIEHHLKRLEALGFKKIIINVAYLGAMIQHALGDGSQYNLDIQYSDESQTGALETAGGIKRALPIISSDPFIVINADIWTDFDFSMLLSPLEQLGRLVVVENPSHNLDGDFYVDAKNQLSLKPKKNHSSYTFSGIAIYHKRIFNNLKDGKHALAPTLRALIKQQLLGVIIHPGRWTDVGTPERLQQLN